MKGTINMYAPVVIPTLNRYEHFKQCIESLERCTGAEFTDVYIGLDFPPSEKYVDGWKKIDNYLKIKEQKNGFKNLIVKRRDHNCGVLVDGSNDQLLRNDVFEKYDRYIFSEDDNIFSPCFLEYINNCFDRFKDDKRITVICGYTHPEFCYKGKPNIQCVIDTPAYGMGCWRWYDQYLNERNYDWFFQELKKSKSRTLKLFMRYPAVIYMCVSMIWRKCNYGDLRQSILNMLNGTYAVSPSVSLVRNIGADGSGLHSGYVKDRDKEEILLQDFFHLDTIEIGTTKDYENRLYKLNMPKNFLVRQICLLQRFIVVLFFLFFDNRRCADDPFNWLITLINYTWEKGIDWKLYLCRKINK